MQDEWSIYDVCRKILELYSQLLLLKIVVCLSSLVNVRETFLSSFVNERKEKNTKGLFFRETEEQILRLSLFNFVHNHRILALLILVPFFCGAFYALILSIVAAPPWITLLLKRRVRVIK